MNADEWAEKIFRDYFYGYADTTLRGEAPGIVKAIASQIREAEEEAYQKGVMEKWEITKVEFMRGRASALEEAAKIVTEITSLHTKPLLEVIAERIRALGEGK